MKRIFVVLLAALMVLTVGLYSLSAFGLPVEENVDSAFVADGEKVLENRFENMLNNNYAYGDEFESIEKILSACEIALADKVKDGKIDNAYLVDFAVNMYGIDVGIFADVDANGVTEVLPKGYEVYDHEITKVSENEDGTYTVYSDVWVDGHDGDNSYEAISTFVKNENSRFGYVLLSSELLEKADAIEAFVL